MSSDFTLNLQDDWDLHVNDAGNLETTEYAQGIAQNVANAFRLFHRKGHPTFSDRT